MNSSHSKPSLPLGLTSDFVSQALGIATSTSFSFTLVTSDSRKVIPGSLFVALKGENVDGHDFIPKALPQGAKGVLCRMDTVLSDSGILAFKVEDTLEAYRRLAAAWRKEFDIPVIAIAGSAGKTTTKELLAAILRGKWPSLLKTEGSQNGYIGIPMTLLDLRSEHQAAVIEVGIDEIGAMEKHMLVVGANASLLTAIGPEHLLNLKDVPTIAYEEGIALRFVAHSHGMVAIHMDDPWIQSHFNDLKTGKKIPYSLEHSYENGVQGKLSSDGLSLSIQSSYQRPFTLNLPLPGKHNASNLLGAVTLALGLGLTGEEISRGLQTFQGAEGRSQIHELPGPTSVICDYYNAQPASVVAGLELLDWVSKQKNNNKPRWACLGDMLELGPLEEKFHRDLAEKIIELSIENILLYGPRMAHLLDELNQRGYSGQTQHFQSQKDLAQHLITHAKMQDTLLIKGSRGMKMEEVWKILQASRVRS